MIFSIKQHLITFDEVHLRSVGKGVGTALSATQLLVEENAAEIKMLKTDLEGEEPRFKPSVHIIVKNKKKITN